MRTRSELGSWARFAALSLSLTACGVAEMSPADCAAAGCPAGQLCHASICISPCASADDCGGGECFPLPDRRFGWCDDGVHDPAGGDFEETPEGGAPGARPDLAPLPERDGVPQAPTPQPEGGEGGAPPADAPPPPPDAPEDEPLAPPADAPPPPPDAPEDEPLAPPPPPPDDGEPAPPPPGQGAPPPEQGAPPPQQSPPPESPPPAPPPESTPEPCRYPQAGGRIALNQVIPALTWGSAFGPGQQATTLNLEQVYCEGRYRTISFIIGAGWCGACPDYFREVARQAAAITAAGSLLVYIETEDGNSRLANSSTAARYVDRYLAQAPGIRVGDADTRPQPGMIQQAPVIGSYPGAFVVRVSDMRVIAQQQGQRFMLDFAALARQAGGGDGPPGGGGGAPPGPAPGPLGGCQEEPHEPNNGPESAARIGVGEFAGGVCGDDADFYQVDVPGRWRLDLFFSHAEGDLDIYFWNSASNQVLTDGGGRPVGSDSSTDNESITGQGPATLVVFGYEGARAAYRLRVSAN